METRSVQEVELWLNRIVFPILFLIGTVGNILSILVFARIKRKMLPISPYLIALAVFDTLILWIDLPRHWIFKSFGYDFRIAHLWLCKTYTFVFFYIIHVAAWIIVVITVHRMITACFPSAKALTGNRAMKIVLPCLLVIMAGIYVHMFWTMTLVDDYYGDGSNFTICTTSKEEMHTEIWKAFIWIDFTLSSIAPFIIIIVANLVTICRVVCSARDVSRERDVNRLTAMVLTISFVFLILTCPLNILYFINDWYALWHTEMPPNVASFVGTFFNILFYSNSAINFLLYLMTVPAFWRELTKLCCNGGGKNKPGPTTTSDIHMTSVN